MATLSASCPGGARAAARVASPRRRGARVVATPSSASTAGRRTTTAVGRFHRFRRRDDGEHDAHPAGDARRTAPRPSRGVVIGGGASSPHRATRRRRARVATRATAPGDSGGVDDAATAATAASSTTENQNSQNPSSPPSHVGADRRRTKSQSPSLRFFPPDVARAVQQCGVGVTVAFGGLVFAVSFATLVFRRVLFCCLHRSPYDRVGAVNADP